MINIDTDILRQLSSAAQLSNQNMVAALQKINTITDHSDWNCRERKSINEKMLSNKALAQKLTSATEEFTSSMNSMVARFDDFKTEAPKAFANLESLLAKKMSIKTPSAVNRVISPAVAISSDKTIKATSRFDNYISNNLSESIKICRFNSFNFK